MELAKRREGLPLVSAFAQLGSVLLFAVLPVVVLILVAHGAGADFLWDFRKEFLPAGRAILDGNSPFPTTSQLASHANYVYPPLAALLLAPFTWLPQTLAEGLYIVVILAAPAVTLWLLGVRDWRCYGIVYLWPPLVGTFLAGALSTLLALAVAVGWRWRHSVAAFGGAIAGAAVAKLFLWPLLVLCTTAARWRAGIISIVVACIAVLASWAVIGFAGLSSYPRLLQNLSHVETPRSYSPTAFALALGLPTSLALVVALIVGLPLLLAAAKLVRRPDGELAALACAVAACFALSPVVWLHYLILLIVPIAVARNRLGPVWFVPLLFWLSPSVASKGNAWEIALAIGVTTLTLVLVAAPGRVLRTAH